VQSKEKKETLPNLHIGGLRMTVQNHIKDHFWSYAALGSVLGWAWFEMRAAPDHAADAYDMDLKVWLCGVCNHVYDEKKEADECCTEFHVGDIEGERDWWAEEMLTPCPLCGWWNEANEPCGYHGKLTKNDLKCDSCGDTAIGVKQGTYIPTCSSCSMNRYITSFHPFGAESFASRVTLHPSPDNRRKCRICQKRIVKGDMRADIHVGDGTSVHLQCFQNLEIEPNARGLCQLCGTRINGDRVGVWIPGRYNSRNAYFHPHCVSNKGTYGAESFNASIKDRMQPKIKRRKIDAETRIIIGEHLTSNIAYLFYDIMDGAVKNGKIAPTQKAFVDYIRKGMNEDWPLDIDIEVMRDLLIDEGYSASNWSDAEIVVALWPEVTRQTMREAKSQAPEIIEWVQTQNHAESFHADPLLDYIKQREREQNAGTVKLQGMGRMKGTKAEDVRVGDVLLWNQGGSSQVLSITPKGKKSLLWKTRTADNREWERTVRKNRLVVVSKPNSYTAKKYQAESFGAENSCEVCTYYRPNQPKDSIEDEGFDLLEPDVMDISDDHLIMSYEGLCEYCENPYTYIVYSKIHTVEYEEGSPFSAESFQAPLFPKRKLRRSLRNACERCGDEGYRKSGISNTQCERCNRWVHNCCLLPSHDRHGEDVVSCQDCAENFASVVLPPVQTEGVVDAAMMHHYMQQRSILEQEVRYLEQELLGGRISRKQFAIKLLELENRFGSEEEPKRKGIVRYMRGVPVKPRKLNGDPDPTEAAQKIDIGRKEPVEAIEVIWDSDNKPETEDPFSEVKWEAESIKRVGEHRVGRVTVEDCVDIRADKADATGRYYRIRFRDPAEFENFRVPAWASRAANTIGRKYYDVLGSQITMGQTKGGEWMIQSVMVPRIPRLTPDGALVIANHIQDRIEREGQWAKADCQDEERVLIVS
jgi:hypothetical protein